MRRNVSKQDLDELLSFIHKSLSRLVTDDQDSYEDYRYICITCSNLINGDLKYGGVMHNYNGLIGTIRMFIDYWSGDACIENDVSTSDMLSMIAYLDDKTRRRFD